MNLASNLHTRTRQPLHLPPSHNKLLVGTCSRKWPNKKTNRHVSLARLLESQCAGRNNDWHSAANWSHSPWWHQHVERREHFIRMVGPTKQELNLTWCTSERRGISVSSKGSDVLYVFLLINSEGSQHHTPLAEQQ